MKRESQNSWGQSCCCCSLPRSGARYKCRRGTGSMGEAAGMRATRDAGQSSLRRQRCALSKNGGELKRCCRNNWLKDRVTYHPTYPARWIHMEGCPIAQFTSSQHTALSFLELLHLSHAGCLQVEMPCGSGNTAKKRINMLVAPFSKPCLPTRRIYPCHRT